MVVIVALIVILTSWLETFYFFTDWGHEQVYEQP